MQHGNFPNVLGNRKYTGFESLSFSRWFVTKLQHYLQLYASFHITKIFYYLAINSKLYEIKY